MLKKPHITLILILLLAVGLRLAVAVYLGNDLPPAKDELSYSTLAERLADGHGYSFPTYWYPFTPPDTPTAHWSFLYTAVLAAIYAISGPLPLVARLFGAVLGGILLPWLVYRLSKRVFPAREHLALVAALFTAVYAYFILFAAQLMTETFYIAALLWSLERGLAFEQALRKEQTPPWSVVVALGVSLGVATLLRQSILPWAAGLWLYLLVVGWRHGLLARTATRLFAAGLILLAFILPFTVRNVLAYDTFLLLNSNTGFAMYSAQHPMHGTSFQAFTAAPLPTDLAATSLNEAEWDRELMGRGMAFVLAEPGRYALLSLSRVADYFMFWPSPTTSTLNNIGRVVSFGLFLPLMLYGLWVSRPYNHTLLLLYLFIVFYAALHILTWAMIRYRLPVDAVLLLFAALGALDLARRWRTARRPSALQTAPES